MARDDEARDGDETTVIARGDRSAGLVGGRSDPVEIRRSGPDDPTAVIGRPPLQPEPVNRRAGPAMTPARRVRDPIPAAGRPIADPTRTPAPGRDRRRRRLKRLREKKAKPAKSKEVKRPEAQTLDLPPGPVLVANGLGLLTKNGWIFKDINLQLRPTTVAAMVGPAGTGRSSLLLALTGRMAAEHRHADRGRALDGGQAGSHPGDHRGGPDRCRGRPGTGLTVRRGDHRALPDRGCRHPRRPGPVRRCVRGARADLRPDRAGRHAGRRSGDVVRGGAGLRPGQRGHRAGRLRSGRVRRDCSSGCSTR